MLIYLCEFVVASTAKSILEEEFEVLAQTDRDCSEASEVGDGWKGVVFEAFDVE